MRFFFDGARENSPFVLRFFFVAVQRGAGAEVGVEKTDL